MKKTVIKDTKKYGKGVFALSDIKKGEIVTILKGTKLDIKEMVTQILKGNTNLDNPLQIGKRTHLILDSYSHSFNHSCDPNCGLRKNTELFAIKDIKKGEELTYDYSLTVAPTEWKMKCKCGSKNCRKIIQDIHTVPTNRLLYYKRLGAIQKYMKNILKLIQEHKYKLPRYEIEAIEKLNIHRK